MTNIKDVAKQAGVSTATVSRVLANNDAVRPETRARVLQAIQDLNYRPNLTARTLRARTSAIIGLVVSDIRNPFFTAISRAVEDTAYAEGYSVLMCNTDENPEKEALYLNLLQDENVAGVIFSPTHSFSESAVSFHPPMPYVIIDRTIRTRYADQVLLDNVQAGYDLACHLIANGYRNIAGLFGNASTTGKERCNGLKKALSENGLSPAALCFVEPRIAHGFRTTAELISSPNRPDAIFTSNSLLTAGAFQAIQERGLTIPGDIALVGFDRTTWGGLVSPSITLIAQPTEEIGRTATELLFQRIAEPNRPPRTIILPGELLVRESSQPRA